jgi:hypothetical protein
MPSLERGLEVNYSLEYKFNFSGKIEMISEVITGRRRAISSPENQSF